MIFCGLKNEDAGTYLFSFSYRLSNLAELRFDVLLVITDGVEELDNSFGGEFRVNLFPIPVQDGRFDPADSVQLFAFET